MARSSGAEAAATPSTLALRVAAGHVGYVASVRAVHLVQHALRISTATRVLPTLCGGIAVAGGSLAAVALSERAARALRGDAPIRGFVERFVRGGARDPHAVPVAPRASFVILGLLFFTATGGRLRALAPSCLLSPGAFADMRRGSLRATIKYATAGERSRIQARRAPRPLSAPRFPLISRARGSSRVALLAQAIGRTYGCHSCGARVGRSFIADHQPTVWSARKANAAVRHTRRDWMAP